MKYGILFAGGGVADCGIIEAGLECAWAVEYDAEIAAAYSVNFPGHRMIVSRVEDVDPADTEPIDALFASPPCPNFSVANAGGEESEQDVAAAEGVCRFIRHHGPRFVVLENVWGYRLSKSFARIIGALDELGYFSRYDHLCAADFGVPQTRMRLILRACRDTMVPSLPPPTRWVGWYEAIKDLLPALEESRFAQWQLDRMDGLPHNSLVADRLSTGGTIPQITGAGEPANTITANSAAHPHRGFLVHGSDMRGMPVVDPEAPAFTVMANPHGNGNTARAFLMDGQTNGGGEDVTSRGGEEPTFTVSATCVKRPGRAFICSGTDATTKRPSEPMVSVTATQGNGTIATRAWLDTGRVVKMSLRALARFQSIPDWYVLPAKAKTAARIIGNGFPSRMAGAIAKVMAAATEDKP